MHTGCFAYSVCVSHRSQSLGSRCAPLSPPPVGVCASNQPTPNMSCEFEQFTVSRKAHAWLPTRVCSVRLRDFPLLLQLPRRPGQLASVLAVVPAQVHLRCIILRVTRIASWLPVHLSYTHNSIAATCWHHHCSFYTVVSLLSCRPHDPARSVIPCLPHTSFEEYIARSLCACQALCLSLRHALSMFVCPLRYSLALLSPAVLRQPCCSVGGVWSINNCFFPVCAVLQDSCVSNTRPSKHACSCCSLPCVSGGPAGGLHAATARGVLSGGSRGGWSMCALLGRWLHPCSCRSVTSLSCLQ